MIVKLVAVKVCSVFLKLARVFRYYVFFAPSHGLNGNHTQGLRGLDGKPVFLLIQLSLLDSNSNIVNLI